MQGRTGIGRLAAEESRYPLMMRALSIKQPYVEEILRGIKTMEFRPKRCRIFNERFYIYTVSRSCGR